MEGSKNKPLWQIPPNSRVEALKSLENYFDEYPNYMNTMDPAEYFFNLNNLLKNAYVIQYRDTAEDFLVKQPVPDYVAGSSPSVVQIDALIERVRRANKDTGVPLMSSEMAGIIEQLTVLRNASVSDNKPLSQLRVRTLFLMLEKDNHRYQDRPCATCREISSAIGTDFGCKRVVAVNDRKGGNP